MAVNADRGTSSRGGVAGPAPNDEDADDRFSSAWRSISRSILRCSSESRFGRLDTTAAKEDCRAERRGGEAGRAEEYTGGDGAPTVAESEDGTEEEEESGCERVGEKERGC
jgi:hypothetical protein